ncbi:MAG: hypothetical protein P9L93_00085 [Candidatus Gorgyraea atricola]|nr:hypothetical protein [Candidatus Gorgyraea atricola]
MKISMALNSFLVILLSGVLFFSGSVFADENDTAAITMLVPSICKLLIDNSNQTMNLLKDASGEAAYEAGYAKGKKKSPKLVVDSNTNWKLGVKVSSDWSAAGSYKKATGDIELKITSKTGHQTGFKKFTSLSLDDQEIASYDAGVNDDVYRGRYRVALDWEKDIPGSYSIVIVYTLSTQSF